VIALDRVSKFYRTDEVETRALDSVSLTVGEGEFVAITGPSGCGKSTLLNLIGLLDNPSQGTLWFNGQNVTDYTEKQLTRLRRESLGFVFQSFNLVEDLSIAENVELGLVYRNVPAVERKKRVGEVLARVDMSHRARHFPRQLSGGQQQRVAIARALVAHPKLILADEPTGNLDTNNGEMVMSLLRAACSSGTSVIMVTHAQEHAAQAHRMVSLLDGRIVSEATGRNQSPPVDASCGIVCN
jgi:putative ABC transport system ATP-binding protein